MCTDTIFFYKTSLQVWKLQNKQMLSITYFFPDKAHTVNYIFITSRDYTWQEAREVCASLNASLIKIDTWEKYTRIRRLYNSTEYWGKLT